MRVLDPTTPLHPPKRNLPATPTRMSRTSSTTRGHRTVLDPRGSGTRWKFVSVVTTRSESTASLFGGTTTSGTIASGAMTRPRSRTWYATCCTSPSHSRSSGWSGKGSVRCDEVLDTETKRGCEKLKRASTHFRNANVNHLGWLVETILGVACLPETRYDTKWHPLTRFAKKCSIVPVSPTKPLSPCSMRRGVKLRTRKTWEKPVKPGENEVQRFRTCFTQYRHLYYHPQHTFITRTTT